MTQLPTTRNQAIDTAWSRTFAAINHPDLSVVTIFALIGLLATLTLAVYLPSSGITAILSTQF